VKPSPAIRSSHVQYDFFIEHDLTRVLIVVQKIIIFGTSSADQSSMARVEEAAVCETMLCNGKEKEK
jgi:hypothetical protein